MSWDPIFVALLPEHLLLAGIVALVALEIGEGKPRATLLLSVLTVAAACAAALALSLGGYDAPPVPRQ
jgi:hypothetical protein